MSEVDEELLRLLRKSAFLVTLPFGSDFERARAAAAWIVGCISSGGFGLIIQSGWRAPKGAGITLRHECERTLTSTPLAKSVLTVAPLASRARAYYRSAWCLICFLFYSASNRILQPWLQLDDRLQVSGRG